MLQELALCTPSSVDIVTFLDLPRPSPCIFNNIVNVLSGRAKANKVQGNWTIMELDLFWSRSKLYQLQLY